VSPISRRRQRLASAEVQRLEELVQRREARLEDARRKLALAKERQKKVAA
jgi:hypothetical protein